MTYSDGIIYEGYFASGLKHGQGELYAKNDFEGFNQGEDLLKLTDSERKKRQEATA